MVDTIMIDTDYDGEIFNVSFSDVPAQREGATVAVKVIDMLGEEAIETKTM